MNEYEWWKWKWMMNMNERDTVEIDWERKIKKNEKDI